MTDNAALAAPLSQEMTAALSKCPPQGSTLSRAKCEKMWGKFHHTRTSVEFKRTWLHLMQLSIGKSAPPVFYQYVTDVMFKSMIKCHYTPTPVTDSQTQDTAPLEYNEKALNVTQLDMYLKPSESVSKGALTHSRRNYCCALLNCVRMMAQTWMPQLIGQWQLVVGGGELCTVSWQTIKHTTSFMEWR